MPDNVDTPVIESKASAEVQTKAEKMGWIPPSRYRGEAERFTDAQEYLDRGEQVLPIIRQTNKRLEAELSAAREETAALKASVTAATAAIEDIKERHSAETARAVERAKVDLKTRLKAASEAGDHDAVAEITGLMIDLTAASKEAPVEKKTPVKEEPKALEIPADMKAWFTENPWYGTDRRKTALANGIAQELRDGGTSLRGVDFFEKVREEVEATFAPTKEPASKVEGARGSGGGGGGGGKQGYAALPADAKAACDADAKNFVGAGKKYKTAAEWQKRYAEIYFEE